MNRHPKKTILAWLLTLALLLALLPTAALAADSTGTSGNTTWKISGTVMTISATSGTDGAMKDYTNVSYATRPYHSQRESITTVIIEDGVTTIGGYAFNGFTSLNSIVIPDSVTSIGAYAFYNCTSLTDIGIPDSVTSIGTYAFYNCTSLTDIGIPDSVTSVGTSAFYNCTSLVSASLSCSVPASGFRYCSSLVSVTVNESDYATEIGNYAFQGCAALTDIVLAYSVTTIGDENVGCVFDGCTSLANITFSSAVTVVGRHSFYDTPLKNIYYYGSQSDAQNVTFGDSNGYISPALKNGGSSTTTVHYLTLQSASPVFYWSEDHSSVTAVFTYNDSADSTNHPSDSISCAVTEDVIVAPTCTEDGETVYTAAVTYRNTAYSDTQTVTVATTGHDYQAVVTAPTCTEQGYTTYTCSACGDSYVSDYVNATGHDYQAVVTAPTCTEGGYTTYTCSTCGDSYVGDETQATGHVYEPTFTWAEDYSGAEAAFTCTACGETQTAECTVTSAENENGTVTYTASCTFGGRTYTVSVTPHTHVYHGTTEVTTAATCTTEGALTVTVDCDLCGEVLYTYTVPVPAAGHTYEGEVIAPTCTEQGYTTYICSDCGDSYVGDYVAATGHDYEGTAKVTQEATCTEAGILTVAISCARCGDTLYTYTENIPAAGHTWDEGAVTKTAACATDGEITYICTDCGETTTETIPATGHTYEGEVTAPTCTGQGYTTYTCSTCGDSYVGDYVAATGHTYVGAAEVTTAATCTEDGVRTVTVSCADCGEILYTYTKTIPATGHTWDEGTVTTEATCTETGEITYACTVCGETTTEAIPATGHTYEGTVEVTKQATETENGERTVSVVCAVCGDVIDSYVIPIPAIGSAEDTNSAADTTVTMAATITMAATADSAENTDSVGDADDGDTAATFLFDDVQDAGAYYYSAVYWAYDSGITTGTTATTFSPNTVCTRAQFVTFLWRLAGEPEPESGETPFTDVTDTSASYYKAVLWAAQTGVTKGTGETTFSPGQTITRAQAVTFLYRYAGQPAVSAENPFSDVADSDYAYQAILWAYETGVTSGTGAGTFSPAQPCTRAMMVSYLYRYAGDTATA